jgi:uncharacterized protein YjbJ (UPF0337 family)
MLPPLFSCVADGDLLESPICDWAAATPPNPTTAATATVVNSLFLISLSSVLPQSQAAAFRIREMPVLDLAMCSPGQRGCDSRVPESSVKNGQCSGNRLGNLELGDWLAVLPGAHGFGGIEMDWDRIEGNWKETKGKIKQKWGQLTDDDLSKINGRRDQLEGKIQQRYGLAKDLVRKDVDDWLNAQP